MTRPPIPGITDHCLAARSSAGPDDNVRRALVLGGGGPLGIAWESGLLSGLIEGGVALPEADLVLGTSAGSVAGAALTLGADLRGLADLAGEPLPLPAGMAQPSFHSLQAALMSAAAHASGPGEALVEIGRVARTSTTASESDYLTHPIFNLLHAQQWPRSFRCTGIDTETAQLTVWDADSGVALDRAAAASCAIPTIFPVIDITGRKYMDGGMRDPLNARLAAGHDVVIVVSCWALELPEDIVDSSSEARDTAAGADFAHLRANGSKVHLVQPSVGYLQLSAFGANIMDVSLVPAAFRAGLDQATAEVKHLRTVWTARSAPPTTEA